MEHKQPENPKPNSNFNPNLLTKMEMNQFFDTQASAFISSNNKKHKPNTQNETYFGRVFK